MGTTVHAEPARRTPAPVVMVSRPTDAAERQAGHAAATVLSGGSVADWSFHAIAPTSLHLDDHDDDAPSPDPDPSAEYEEAMSTVGQALLQTDTVQRIIAEVRSDPTVRAIEGALTSDPALITYGVLGVGAIGAGIGGIAARGGRPREPGDGSALPFQMPMVPVSGPWSAQVRWEGAVDAPSFAGVVIRWQPEASGGGDAGRAAEDARRLAVELARFREGLRTPEEREVEAERMARALAIGVPWMPTVVVPLDAGQPRLAPASRFQLEMPSMLRWPGPRMPSVLDDELELGPMPTLPAMPVSRDADDTAAAVDSEDRAVGIGRRRTRPSVASGLAGVVAEPGRPLGEDVRSRMEPAFGWDFGDVRLHTDTTAETLADEVGARAVAVGEHIAGPASNLDPGVPAGRRTLAHELAHVVQAGRGRPLDGPMRDVAAGVDGLDVGRVRIHGDPVAAAVVADHSAAALTIGDDILLGRGISPPHSEHAWGVYDHELRHVAQSQERATHEPLRLADDDRAERAADEGVTAGGTTPGVYAHPIGKVARWSLRKLSKRPLRKHISKHVQKHTRRIAGKAVHSVFRKPREIRAIVKQALEEAVELAARNPGVRGGVIEAAGLRVVEQVGRGKTRYVVEKTFRRAIGTAGQTVLRVVVDASGRIVTAFPADRLIALGLTATALDAITASTAEAAEGVRESVERQEAYLALSRAAAEDASDSGWIGWIPIIGDLHGGSLNAGEGDAVRAMHEEARRDRDVATVVSATIATIEEELQMSLDERDRALVEEEVRFILVSGMALDAEDEEVAP